MAVGEVAAEVQRLERLEKTVYENLEPRVAKLEQQQAATDVRFEMIMTNIDELKEGFKRVTAWTQATAITVGLSLLGLIAAWMFGGK
ncbi:hypothetical protein [Neomoorella thermoacetica]|uniref:hypothetical protein n=1 Tax=Neomoorella thermoacetica TaxID=1525 RepID=UPI001E616586|nr:hypothetical protein [Moorella thermoacetica]